MAWIKIDQAVASHPKTRRLARILRTSIPEAVGLLTMLWSWAIDYAPDGSLERYDADDIADAVLWNRDPQEFIDAATDAGYIDRDESGYSLHDWHEHQGRLIEKRSADSARKRAERKGKDVPPASAAPVLSPTSSPSIAPVAPIPTDVRRMSDGCPTDGERKSKSKSKNENTTLSNERVDARAGAETPLPSAEICRRWNETVTTSPKVNTISGQREKLLRARWKEHPDIEWWQALFERITRSGFLTGRNERGWVCTFDWLIKPVNLDKLLGGNYDDREKTTPRVSGPQHVGQGSGPGGFDLGAYEKMSRLSPKPYEKEATG